MSQDEKAPLLQARDITKDFPGVRALDGVTFDVRSGEVHALVGENGAGKSTLIKVLSGVYPYGSYGGEVLVDDRATRFLSIRDAETAGLAVIHQELALVKHMTVGENILLGDEPSRFGFVDEDRLYAEAERVMDQLGVEVNVRSEVVHLGVGEQQLVEIAKAVRKKGRVLILDEPTAALADHEIEVLMRIMRGLRDEGTGLVYISHKLDEVFQIADRITVLRDGKTVATESVGNWRRDQVVNVMVGRELTEMFPKEEHALGDVVLDVEDLSLEDPDVPGRMLLENVTFSLRKGEILGIAGLMGAGRTELLSALFGAAAGWKQGRVRVEGRETRIDGPGDAIRAGLALVPEDRKNHGLGLIFSVLENLSMVHLNAYSRLGFVDAQRELTEGQKTADELQVKAASMGVPVETLSGGNQQKVVLGKWLLRRPKVLFLDEPTRGVDVGAKAEIHRLIGGLTAQGMGVVMVSSELPEVLGVADRVLVLRSGRVSKVFERSQATADLVMEAAT